MTSTMCLLATWSLLTLLISACNCESGSSVAAANEVSPSLSLRTTTVYGFLDFTTTIDQTVVVFRPSSHAPSSTSSKASIQASAGLTSVVERDIAPDHQQTTIRTAADDEPLVSARILPTPTLSSKQTTPSPPSSRPRAGSPSSLADKRRRFLAQVRRQRPLLPNVSSSTGSPSPRQGANGHHSDQDMAETIDVIPSKVKRYHEDASVTDDVSRNGHSVNRLLALKLYRRPNLHSDVSSSKNRLLALRNRANAKNHVRGRVNPDDVNTHDAPMVTSSKPLFDPTSATIAEYLPIQDDDVGAAIRKPIKSSPSKLEVESKVLLESSQSDIALSSASVWDDQETMATAPLPVVKSASGDPGLTVPIQLSIVTSTFSSTETRLRTSLLPVYDGTSTTFYTLTHSFLVTKMVTTFQTVPPEEFMPYLIPGNDSINAINDVLPDWMDDEETPGQSKSDLSSEIIEEANNPIEKVVEEEHEEVIAPSTSDPMAIYSQQQQQQQGMNPLLQNLPFLNLLGPAAALGLNPYFPYGLGQLGPQLVTTSRPVFSTSVVFTSKLLPIIDGLTTSYHTVRAAASTVTHTSYETFTTQLAQQSPGNGQGGAGGVGGPGAGGAGGGGGMSTVVNPHTFVTTETQTATQVFKLMYDGYKTSYRTVSSLTEVTRTVTTLTTTTVPLHTHAQYLPFFG